MSNSTVVRDNESLRKKFKAALNFFLSDSLSLTTVEFDILLLNSSPTLSHASWPKGRASAPTCVLGAKNFSLALQPLYCAMVFSAAVANFRLSPSLFLLISARPSFLLLLVLLPSTYDL